MSDFETHPRGTHEEIRLSRRLANVITEELEMSGEDIPHRIMLAYQELYAYHIAMIREETL